MGRGTFDDTVREFDSARCITTTTRRSGLRSATAGLTGLALATGVGLAAAPATAAPLAPTSTIGQVTQLATAPVSAVAANGIRFVAAPAAADPLRHDVASPQTIGTSALAGAAIGAVVGFGVGFVLAPAVGAVTVGVATVATGLCAAAGAPTGIGIPICLVAVPLAGAIGAPVATIASPLLGAVIGAGIGGAIGAGVGSTYASAPVRVDAAAPKVSATPVSDLIEALPPVAAPVVKAAKSSPTVGNINLALDRAAATNPQLGQVVDFAKSALPRK